MRVEHVKELLPICFTSNVVPFLWGEHGIGKSEVVFQVGKATGRRVIDLRLGLMETGDLIGLPQGTDDNNRTVYTKPNWFPMGDEPTILFLDEINRATIPVLQAIFQLILNRRLNDHILPDNCSMVAAGNPSGHNYIVSEMDDALINRFLHIKFNPSTEEFLNYAVSNKFDSSVVGFLTKMKDMIGYDLCEVNLDLKPKPRAWGMYAKIFPKLPQHLILETCKGLVGDKVGLAFYEFLKTVDMPVHGADVLEDYKSARPLILKYSNASGKEKVVRVDLLDVTSRELINQLVERAKGDLFGAKDKFLTEKEEKNFLDFLNDLPTDLLFNTVKTLKDSAYLAALLVKHPEIGKKLVNIRDIKAKI